MNFLDAISKLLKGRDSAMVDLIIKRLDKENKELHDRLDKVEEVQLQDAENCERRLKELEKEYKTLTEYYITLKRGL